jgi:hypothetical protein
VQGDEVAVGLAQSVDAQHPAHLGAARRGRPARRGRTSVHRRRELACAQVCRPPRVITARMRRLPSLSPIFLAASHVLCAGRCGRIAPAGPAIAYANAFPAQAGFDRPLFVAFTASDPAHAYVVTPAGPGVRGPRDGSKADRGTRSSTSARRCSPTTGRKVCSASRSIRPTRRTASSIACWSERSNAARGDGQRQGGEEQSPVGDRALRVNGKAGVVMPRRRSRQRAARARGVPAVRQPQRRHHRVRPRRHALRGARRRRCGERPVRQRAEQVRCCSARCCASTCQGCKEQPYTIPKDNPFVGKDGRAARSGARPAQSVAHRVRSQDRRAVVWRRRPESHRRGRSAREGRQLRLERDGGERGVRAAQGRRRRRPKARSLPIAEYPHSRGPVDHRRPRLPRHRDPGARTAGSSTATSCR